MEPKFMKNQSPNLSHLELGYQMLENGHWKPPEARKFEPRSQKKVSIRWQSPQYPVSIRRPAPQDSVTDPASNICIRPPKAGEQQILI